MTGATNEEFEKMVWLLGWCLPSILHSIIPKVESKPCLFLVY